MPDYNGVIWRVNYGEIAERDQFRIGYIGQQTFDGYFELAQLSDLITVLSDVQGASLDQLTKGSTVQARKVSDGIVTRVIIEPRSDTFPPQIMSLGLTTLSDLIYALQLFQSAAYSAPIPDDWDLSFRPQVVYLDKKGQLQPWGPVSDAISIVAGVSISVKNPRFGATGDGVHDDTVAVQSAIDAAAPGDEVYFPPGTYLVRGLSGTGKSNITLRGIRGASKIQYKTAGAVDGNNLLGWNETANPATNNRNVTIRDLWFNGVSGMVEHQAQLHLSAIDDLTIEGCIFTQFQGDAITIARTRIGGTDSGVINRRVKILHNTFDGVDYTNRNAITIIAGDDILIQGNSFTRCSAPTMPGAIDVEPNSFDTTASITDLKILDNTFINCGGNSGDIGVALVPATFTAARWQVAGNTFRGSKGPTLRFKWHNHAATDTDPWLDLLVRSNIIGAPDAGYSGPTLIIEGLRGWNVDSNRFTGIAKAPMQIGYDSVRTVKDGSIARNVFNDCGGTDGYVINLNYGNRVELLGNKVYKSGSVLSAMLSVAGPGASNTTDIVANDNRAIGVNNVVSFGGGTTSVSTNHAARNLGFISSDPEPPSYFANIGRSGYYAAKTVTIDYTVTRSDSIIIGNGANITATLPDPSLVSKDRIYILKNTHSTPMTVVSAGASKTIDGAASQTLTQWASGEYVSDGFRWLSSSNVGSSPDSTRGLYSRTQPTPGGFSFRAIAKDPNQNGVNGTGRVWGVGTQFAQIGFTDDDGATWTVKSVNFQSGVSIQQMKFSASFLWIVTSAAGSQNGNVWRMPLPDANGNFPGVGLGTLANLWGTTISSASNGQTLPQATINITNGNYFKSTGGTVTVNTSAGPQIVTYTGKTAGTLTGCSGGTGTMSTGGNVLSEVVRVFGLDNLAGGPGSASSSGNVNASFRNSCFDINATETAAWVGEYGTGNATYQFPTVTDGIIAAGNTLLHSTSMVAAAQMVGLSITVTGAGLGGADLTANVMEIVQLNDVSNPAVLRLSAPARTTVTAATVTFPSTTYGSGNIPGGPSVYRCVNPTAAAASVVWTKDKTFQQGKHIHSVKFFGGLPHVGIGDLSKQFKDCGIWVGNSATAPSLWVQRSLAPTGTIPKDPINMIQVTIDGKDALACESDSSFYDGPLTYTDATGTGNRVLESQCKIPAPYTQTMRGLTLDPATGNLYWFGTSEAGALGPTSCIWMSRAPYTKPVLLEDVGASMDTETVGDGVLSNGYVWFGTRRVQIEKFRDQP